MTITMHVVFTVYGGCIDCEPKVFSTEEKARSFIKSFGQQGFDYLKIVDDEIEMDERSYIDKWNPNERLEIHWFPAELDQES